MSSKLRSLVTAAFAFFMTTQSFAAIPVFRSPQSRYDSGLADHSLLKKNIKTISPKHWAQITQDNKNYWIETDHLIHPIQFALTATTRKTSFTYSQANLKHKNKTPLEAGARVLVHELSPPWAEVSTLKRPKEKFWIEHNNLLAKDIFRGYVYAKDRTILYRKAHEKSKILTLLDTDTKLSIKSIQDKWVHISFGKLSGYVLIEQVLGPWTIAHSVKSDGSWHIVQSIAEDKIITPEKKKISVSKIDNLRFSQKKRLVGGRGLKLRQQPDSKVKSVSELPAGALVFLNKKIHELWAESHVSYLGDVWWKMIEDNSLSESMVDNKTLFSKQIFDMASSPKVPGLVFTSADGLYRSTDGHLWKPVERFKGKNLALAVSKNGTVFAGPYFSKDDGKTFESFIRWDRFIHQLQRSVPTLPVRGLSSVRITKLTPLGSSDNHLGIELLIADKKLKAETKNRGKSWIFSN